MNRIVEYLERNGHSQRALADYVGVTETTMSRYVNESREPRVSTAVMMAKFCGATVEELFPQDPGRR